MIGVLIGCTLGLAAVLTADYSWWLVLLGALLGGVCEFFVRLGAGQEFGDAVGSMVTLGMDLSSTGGGDCGSSGGSFDCGGGGGDGGGGGGGCSGGGGD